MINLKTMPLCDVPIGGVFIARSSDVSMDFVDEPLFNAYVKSRKGFWNSYFFRVDEGPSDIDYGAVNDAQVAYTGIVLPTIRS